MEFYSGGNSSIQNKLRVFTLQAKKKGGKGGEKGRGKRRRKKQKRKEKKKAVRLVAGLSKYTI